MDFNTKTVEYRATRYEIKNLFYQSIDPHDPLVDHLTREAPKAPRSQARRRRRRGRKRGAEGAEVVSEAPKAPRIELLHPRVSCCILV